MKTRFIDFSVLLFLLFFNTQAIAGITITLDSDRLYDYALKSYRAGDFPESASAFHSFGHFFPGDKRAGEALVLRGFSLYSIKKYQEAASAFRSVFDSGKYGAKVLNTAGLMTAQSLSASGDRPSAIAFMENWALSAGNDNPFLDRIKYETAWLYLSNDDRQTAEKRFLSVKAAFEYKISEIQKELEKVPDLEKSPGLAGTLAVVPGGGFAYLGRYSDAFAALVVNSALGIAAWQSFDKEMPALGGIISFVGAGFYLGGIYGSVSAARKMNRKNRAAFYESLKTGFYVSEHGAGIGMSVDF